MNKDTLNEYLKKKDISQRELDKIVDEYLAKRDKEPTLRKYLEKTSCSAWISFVFSIYNDVYSCVSVESFLQTYGTINEYILDKYVVINVMKSGFSQSQGSVYYLTLKQKERNN